MFHAAEFPAMNRVGGVDDTQCSTQNSDPAHAVTQTQAQTQDAAQKLVSAEMANLVHSGLARRVWFVHGALGLKLAFKKSVVEGDGVVVMGFITNKNGERGQAAASQQVSVGDYLLAIRDIDVRGASFEQVAHLLQSLPRPFAITFCAADARPQCERPSRNDHLIFIRNPAGFVFSPSQKKAIEAPRGPVLIEAGPGSGKTTVLVFRIRHMVCSCGISPSKIAVLAFTNRAAQEFRQRVDSLLICGPGSNDKVEGSLSEERSTSVADRLGFIGTFHAFSLKFIQQHGHGTLGLPPHFSVLAGLEHSELVQDLLREFAMDTHGSIKAIAAQAATKINDAKRRVALDPILLHTVQKVWPRGKAEVLAAVQRHVDTAIGRELCTLWTSGHRRAVAKSFAAAYTKLLRAMGCMDFSDLLLFGLLMLQMANVRPPLPGLSSVADVQEFFQCVMVDELQDVDAVQREMLKLLVSSHSNVTAVGDFDQTIFSWRKFDLGNSPGTKTVRGRRQIQDQRSSEFFKEFSNHSRVAGEQVNGCAIKMSDNFRSTEHVLRCAHAVLEAPLGPQTSMDRRSSPPQTSRAHPKLAAGDDVVEWTNQDAMARAAWKVVVQKFCGRRKEAEFAASTAAQATSRNLRCAILFRNNYQGSIFEDALSDVGLSFYHVQSNSTAMTTPEVRGFLAILRVAVSKPSNFLAFRRALQFCVRPGGKDCWSGLRLAEHIAEIGLQMQVPNSSLERSDSSPEGLRLAVTTNKVDLMAALQSFLRTPGQSQSASSSAESRKFKGLDNDQYSDLQRFAILLTHLQQQRTEPIGRILRSALTHPYFCDVVLRHCRREEHQLRNCWRNLLFLFPHPGARSNKWAGSQLSSQGDIGISSIDPSVQLFTIFRYMEGYMSPAGGRLMEYIPARDVNARNEEEDDENIDYSLSFECSMWGDDDTEANERIDAESSAPVSLDQYLSELAVHASAFEEQKASMEQGAIALSTIHQAKGREWDVVVVAGLEEGTLPHYKCERPRSRLAEEQRLLYVAMTRAKSQLILTYVSSASTWARHKSRSRCRWLECLPAEHCMTVEEVPIVGNISPMSSGARRQQSHATPTRDRVAKVDPTAAVLHAKNACTDKLARSSRKQVWRPWRPVRGDLQRQPSSTTANGTQESRTPPRTSPQKRKSSSASPLVNGARHIRAQRNVRLETSPRFTPSQTAKRVCLGSMQTAPTPCTLQASASADTPATVLNTPRTDSLSAETPPTVVNTPLSSSHGPTRGRAVDMGKNRAVDLRAALVFSPTNRRHQPSADVG